MTGKVGIILAAMLSFAGVSKAAVLFSQSGDDLLMTVTESFSITLTKRSLDLDLVFPNVKPPLSDPYGFSMSPSSGFSLNGEPLSYSTMWLGYDAGVVHAEDVRIEFMTPYPLNAGSVLTVDAGVYTAINWFTLPNRVVPNSPTTAYLLNGSDANDIVSNTYSFATVPEPSSGLLLIVSIIGFLILKRRPQKLPRFPQRTFYFNSPRHRHSRGGWRQISRSDVNYGNIVSLNTK